jgi:hypothetical protein
MRAQQGIETGVFVFLFFDAQMSTRREIEEIRGALAIAGFSALALG